MATFERRPWGTWRAKIRRRGFPVKQATFDTRAEAERWARKIEREMDQGQHRLSPSSYPTLRELLERYRNEVTPRKRSADTEHYRINAWLRTSLADRPADRIATRDIRDWRDRRLRQVGPDSVRLELAVLRHLYNYARTEWEYDALANPCSGVKIPPGRKRQRRLRRGELLRLYRAAIRCRRGYMILIIRLAIETTMREGEIARLHGDHIDLERRTAYLPRTKNGEPRTVPLTRGAARAIARLHPQPGRWLIRPDQPKRATVADWIGRAFAEIVTEAGIEDLRFHDLRHEGTSRLFETTDLTDLEIMSITGHKTPTMLARYTHLRAGHLVRRLG